MPKAESMYFAPCQDQRDPIRKVHPVHQRQVLIATEYIVTIVPGMIEVMM